MRSRLTFVVAVGALAVALLGPLMGDRTSWTHGFGSDGALYGDLAQHCPSGLFGNAGVALPTPSNTRGNPPKGVDNYYAARVLPSCLVYYTLDVLHVPKTHLAVVRAFQVYDTALLLVVALGWILVARALALSRRGTILGAGALMLNFAAAKTDTYWPVATDPFAYGLGMLSLVFWVRDRRIALAAVAFASAFTWPLQTYAALALLAFPRSGPPLFGSVLALRSRDRQRVALNAAALAVTLAIAVGCIYWVVHSALVYISGTPYPTAALRLRPLSFAVTATYIVAAAVWLLPDLSQLQPRRLLRPLLGGRGALILAVVVGANLLVQWIAVRPGLTATQLLVESLAFSTIVPGIFLAALFGYYGPILAVGVVCWRRARTELHRLGAGATLAVAIFLLGATLAEPRKVVAVYPVAVLCCVLASERVRWRRGFLPAFLGVSFLVSRVWFPIGPLPQNTSSTFLLSFPGQRFYMSTGIWMSRQMYLVHVAGALATVALVALARRRQPQELAAGDPRALARRIRTTVLERSRAANVGHIGSNLSVADVLAALYGGVVRGAGTADPERDRFVLSKGHAALALYAALHENGALPAEALEAFCTDGAELGVHPDVGVPGVDFATGSLGHGLPMAVGAALAARLQGSERRVFTLLSDAECNEGSVWEAAMFAAHHRLDNLIAIVDVNGQQALARTRDVLDLEPLGRRWRTFRWDVFEVDGTDPEALRDVLTWIRDSPAGRPSVMLARTVFGRGVSFMESRIEWHYLPMTEDDYARALEEARA